MTIEVAIIGLGIMGCRMLNHMRIHEEFNPDYSIWMDTIKEGRFEDTNKMFEKPESPDFTVSEWKDDTHFKLEKEINQFIEKRKNV